jgi:RNA polymerase sigma-70 factor (ECF subfamily)
VRQLYEQYAERLLACARRRISQRLASRVDPDDVVQSVFRTVVGRMKEGRFEIKDQDDLCKLLTRITVNKTLRQVEFHKAAKRNPNLEQGQSERAEEELRRVLDKGPGPEAEVVFADELEHFMNQLRPEEQRILELKMNGYSNREIAEQLGSYERKVTRVIERIRGLLEQEELPE